MEHPRGTVARMVHDFVDLERRVRQLEEGARDGDARLQRAFTPTPFEKTDMDEYLGQLNKLYERMVARHAVQDLTRTADTETVVETSVKVKTRPNSWCRATAPDGVKETTQLVQATPTLVTVTWEDTVSGVKVTSVPCSNSAEASQSAKHLYDVALAEHLCSFKDTYWFTVDDFKRLRKATFADHGLCMRALHSTTTYERALGWLLNRDVKLKP